MNSIVECSELFSSILSFLPLHYWYNYKSICKKWFNVCETNTFKKKKQEVKDHPTEFRYFKSLAWERDHDFVYCFDENNTLYLFENTYSQCNIHTLDINSSEFKHCLSFIQYAPVTQVIVENKVAVFIDDYYDLSVMNLQDLNKCHPKIIQSISGLLSIAVDQTHFYFQKQNETIVSIPKSSIFEMHVEGMKDICCSAYWKPMTFNIHNDYIIQAERTTLLFYDKKVTSQKDPQKG